MLCIAPDARIIVHGHHSKFLEAAASDRRFTCDDAQASADSAQGSGVALAGDRAQAVLLGPLAAHMVRGPEGSLPIHPGAPTQYLASQDAHACSQHFRSAMRTRRRIWMQFSGNFPGA